ncbi:MAG: hypothetical protein B7Y21_03890, partial [Hydrogenophilales bacterium 16-61-112]
MNAIQAANAFNGHVGGLCCDIFKAGLGGSSVFKKQWPAFVLAFVLPLVAVFWWWGGFSPVSV